MRLSPWLMAGMFVAAPIGVAHGSFGVPHDQAPKAARVSIAASAARAARPQVLWVDPTRGRDGAAGTRAAPLRTVTEAWERIPQRRALTRPVWIQLRPGVYEADTTPGYWEHRWGTSQAPVVLNAKPGTVVWRGDINAFDVRHLRVIGVTIDRAGDSFHCERCSFVLLRRMKLDSHSAAQETIKVNQSDHIAILDSDVANATQNPIDFVAVQHATIRGNRIHGAGDWCTYVKGGSAYIRVQGNEIYDCDTGGFSAGQGTGFEYMVRPWLRYETYGVTVTDNVIHDTVGAGLGVNGSYNTVMAFNTLYRVGTRSHLVEFVHGARSCDGDTARCARNRAAGGWGGPGIEGQFIPNRHVVFVNNLIVNPPGVRSAWQHVAVADPVTPQPGSGVPAPSRADDDLVIKGNVISNGSPDMPSGVPDDAAFRRDNRVNTLVPDLVDPARGVFRPQPGGRLAALRSVPVPRLTWSDAGVPGVRERVIQSHRPPGALRPTR